MMSISGNNINNNNMISNGCSGGSKTRLIRLRRHGSTQLGFSIRGGWEHGTGIYVSEVHPQSEADKQGLKAGDQILRINGIHLMNSIHADVIALIKASTRLVLKVKSVGMIPIKDRNDDILTWKLMANSCGSTPLMSSPSPVCTSSDSHSDSDIDFLETKVFIDLMGKPLGCSVAKGPINNTGIYVQNVKFGEIADQCGLQVGDQIIEVNGVNVSQMEFSDAISKLKSLPSMTLTVRKGVGKHLFCVNAFDDMHSTYKNDSGFVENNHKKKVEAVIHHHHNNSNGHNGHARILSSSSNCSETSSDYGGSSVGGGSGSVGTGGGGKNFKHLIVENDYSISELETSNAGIIQNNLSKQANQRNSDNLLDIVKKEEQRLAEERRKLEDDQKKLKLEMEKLELEKKELERRKQLDECQSISGCSISSTSLSSSGSQSISFLEEIKMFSSDKNRRALKPVKSNISSDHSDNDNNTNGGLNGSVTSDARDERTKRAAVVTGRYDISEKNKQHELLMEEFRRAHKRMFGQSNDNSSDGINNNNNNSSSNNSESARCDSNSVIQNKTQAINQINQINNHNNNNNVVLNTNDKIKESKSILQISAATKTCSVIPPPPPPLTTTFKPITATPTILKTTQSIPAPPVSAKTTTTTTSAAITANNVTTKAVTVKQQPIITVKELRKIPPEVPVKSKSHQTSNGPIVTIGTYANNTFNKNNRFAPQYHRSIIHVLSDESANKN